MNKTPPTSYIVLITYKKIYLYREINKVITRIPFANGEMSLNACIGFNYEKGWIDFYPEHSVFESNYTSILNSDSSFAGYTFSIGENIQELVDSLFLSDKYISNLSSKDKAYLIIESGFYQYKSIEENSNNELKKSGKMLKSRIRIGVFDFHDLIRMTISSISCFIDKNIIFSNENSFVGQLCYSDNQSLAFGSFSIISDAASEAMYSFTNNFDLGKYTLAKVKDYSVDYYLNNEKFPDYVIYKNRKIPIKGTLIEDEISLAVDITNKRMDDDSINFDSEEVHYFDLGLVKKTKEPIEKFKNLICHNKFESEQFLFLIFRFMLLHDEFLNNSMYQAIIAQHRKDMVENGVALETMGGYCYSMRVMPAEIQNKFINSHEYSVIKKALTSN